MTFSKPIVVAINGVAVGFGATMPLICDIRIASTKARFSFAFARLGVTPEFCSSYFLPRLIGSGKAAELVFRARMIDAEEALSLGLVNRVVPPEKLLDEARSMAEGNRTNAGVGPADVQAFAASWQPVDHAADVGIRGCRFPAELPDPGALRGGMPDAG